MKRNLIAFLDAGRFDLNFVLGCSNLHVLNASYGNSHSVRRYINNYLDQSAIRMPVADWSNLASAQCLQTRF